MDLREMLKQNEGIRTFPYTCPSAKITIGVGRNLTDKGISLAEVEIMFEADIAVAKQNLRDIFDGELILDLSDNRHNALVDMMFNLGMTRFRGFKKMIRGIKKGDWKEVAKQCLDSNYAKQVPHRAQRNATYLRKG